MCAFNLLDSLVASRKAVSHPSSMTIGPVLITSIACSANHGSEKEADNLQIQEERSKQQNLQRAAVWADEEDE